MTTKGGKVYEAISSDAYNRRITGKGKTYREKSLEKIECKLCGEVVGRQYMKNHQQSEKCKNQRKQHKKEEEEELENQPIDNTQYTRTESVPAPEPDT